MDSELINLASQMEKKFKEDPTSFSVDILNSKLWSKQNEILQSVFDHQHTIVQSCYGSGKSFVAARVALTYLYTHVPSKVIITSSSWTQVEKIIWSEIAAAYAQAQYPLGGKLLTTELEIRKNWFAIGISPQINVDSEAYRFEGFHSPNVLVIMDQAQGINKKLWNVAKALISNANSRMLVLGNPIHKSGPFYDACMNNDGLWNKIKISAHDIPNVQEGKDVVPGLISKLWVENRKQDWGVSHPLYISKVLAEFPEEAEDLIITLGMIEAAKNLTNIVESNKGIGVDIARFGNDKTVLIYKEGERVKDIQVFLKQDTMMTTGRIIHMMDKYGVAASCVAVDDTGVGGGVTDRLREQGFVVQAVNNGSRPDNEQYADRGSELWWAMRKLFEVGNIAIPDHDELISQLVNRKYGVNSKGKIKIESKDDMRKRGAKSPDHADALALAIVAQKGFVNTGPRVTVI